MKVKIKANKENWMEHWDYVNVELYALVKQIKKSQNYKMTKEERIKKYLRLTRIKRAFTARAASLVVTSLIGWLVTGDPWIGLSIGAIDLVIKLFVYYGHESLWEKKMTDDIRKIKIKYD